MKHYIIPFIFSLFCISFASCSDDDGVKPVEQAPDWAYVANDMHTASMTIVATVSMEEGLYTSASDKIAAFIGDECRGVGTLIGEDFYIMVKGEADESRMVTFKYYSSSRKYVYEAENWCEFEPDATYGTADSPVVLKFLQK